MGSEDSPLKEGNRIAKIGRPCHERISRRPDSASPVVQFAPSDIARRRIVTWHGIQTDAVEVVRREPFEAGFQAPYLLIMCERAERGEGETLVEGLPRSTLHEFSRTLSFVPAGHRFCGTSRASSRVRLIPTSIRAAP